MVAANTKRTLPFVLDAPRLWGLTLGRIEAWLSRLIPLGVDIAVPTVIHERLPERGHQ